MTVRLRWVLVGLIVFMIGVVPVIVYRATYAHSKRLRVVTPGKVYRSGQLTVAGFEEAIQRYQIRTVVNLQDEYPDPEVTKGYFNRGSLPETKVCEKLGVKYVFIALDLVPRRQTFDRRPAAIEQMLALFDDPANYPILIHCRAGLHRTGCMVSVYRMEYDGWTPQQALAEMRANGFGDTACTAANDYVYQYVVNYRRGMRSGKSSAVSQTNNHE